MALFKKNPKKSDEELTTYIGSDSDHIGEPPEQHEENETEEKEWSPEVGHTPPKRRIRIDDDSIAEDDEAITEVIPISLPIKFKSNIPNKDSSKEPAKRDKVYLSTDIARDLHSRLRIHSFKTGKPLGIIIEEMITKCYPE